MYTLFYNKKKEKKEIENNPKHRSIINYYNVKRNKQKYISLIFFPLFKYLAKVTVININLRVLMVTHSNLLSNEWRKKNCSTLLICHVVTES